LVVLAPDLDGSLSAARNVPGLVGLVLIVRPRLGDAAWLCPAAFAAAAQLFGGSAYDRPAAWAWTLHPASARGPAIVAAALVVAGLLMLRREWARGQVVQG
jgi:uncharacterized membrane protein YdcZ (DUF606 family)